MKKYIKKIFTSKLNIFKNDIFFKSFIKNDLLILLYHDISDKPSEFHKQNNLNVTVENFKNQLNFFQKYYNFISPLDLLNGNFTRPAAMITFDDGIKTNFQIAIDILLQKNLASLHFLNFSPIIGKFFYSGLVNYLYYKNILKNYNYLTVPNEIVLDFLSNKDLMRNVYEFHGPFANEDDLKSFENNKLVFYGNHLYNHYNVLNISLDFFKYNYLKNKKFLENYKNNIDFFSYPFGAKNLCYNDNTDKFLIENLRPKKFFYADCLSFNTKDSQSYHRFAPDNNMDENLFKSQIILQKTKNTFLTY